MPDGILAAPRPLPADRPAAERLACEWITAHPDEMRDIARGSHAPSYQVTGPAMDAIASILLRGDEPAQNVGLIVDAVARELRPRGACVDPHTLESHGGSLHVMDLYTAGLYDAPLVTREPTDDLVTSADARIPINQPSKVAAAKVLRTLDRGQNHRDRNHRAKEKQARAREAGQGWFTGWSWRVPDDRGAANDDANPGCVLHTRAGRETK
jgi:hypothetical protein